MSAYAAKIRKLESELERWQNFWGKDCQVSIGGVYCEEVSVAQIPCKPGGINAAGDGCELGMETTWKEVHPQ